MSFRPSVKMATLIASSGNFFIAYISSHADVASKSPANFKPKPSLILSTDIPKFDAIIHPFCFPTAFLISPNFS